MFEEEEILGDLNSQLRSELLLHNARKLIESVPLLRDAAQEVVFPKMLATKLVPEAVLMNDIVFLEGHAGTKLYMIAHGVIELRVSWLKDEHLMEGGKSHGGIYNTIGDGCYFGEVSLLMGTRRTATARSCLACTLYTVDKESLDWALQDNPQTEAYMRQVAEARLTRMQVLNTKTPGHMRKQFLRRKTLDRYGAWKTGP